MEVLILARMLQRCLRPNHEKCTRLDKYATVVSRAVACDAAMGQMREGPRPPGLVERSPKQRMQNYEEAARSSPHLTSCSCCFCTSSRPRRCPALPCRPLLICWQTCGDIRDGGKLVFPQLRSSPLKVAHPCRRRLCMFCQTSSRERGAAMQIATSGPA